MLPHSKRNGLTYALFTLDHDETALAAYLGVSVQELVNYLHGQNEVPIPILLKAVRLVLARTKADNATQSAVLRKIEEAQKRA